MACIPVVVSILTGVIIYLVGIGSGLLVCCRYKHKFMSSSSSSDDITTIQGEEAKPTVQTITLTT